MADTENTVFTFYGRDNCPYCVKAKALLEEKGFEIDYRDTTLPGVKNELLLRNPDATTVPQIFLGETLIGGHSHLVEYFDPIDTTI
jgi:glutaredoxin 3